MKIWMTGSTGMVGRGLQDYLKSRGHELTALVRREKPGREEIFWNPGSGELEPEDRLDRPDVIIHLAGENIASGRWSQERKRAIRESRVSGTRLLAENLVRKKLDPEVFISASAIGFYGNRGEEILSEGSCGMGKCRGILGREEPGYSFEIWDDSEWDGRRFEEDATCFQSGIGRTIGKWEAVCQLGIAAGCGPDCGTSD
jgi:nucleoside-diphosphate-sugar epimerase